MDRMISSISCAPDHPDLVYTRKQGPFKKRYLYRLQGFSPVKTFNVYHTDHLDTLVRAVKERIFFVKSVDGEFIPPAIASSYQYVFDNLLPFFSIFRTYVRHSTPMSLEQFSASYTGRKRAIYEDAVKSFSNKPLSKVDSKVKVFVKVEKSNKVDPVPRVISPRSPRYHVSVGRFIKPIEKKIYKAIGSVFGATTVFKGLNAKDRGQRLREHWESFDDPVVFLLDASRFDQHISVLLLKWEHMIYELYYSGMKVLAMLLRWQLVNSGVAYVSDGKLKFTVVGKRMSGDINTALGNCLIMCALVYSFIVTIGISKFRLADDGDDCVLFIERRDADRVKSTLSDWFLRMGLVMKVIGPIDVFEKIEFCQAQPVWTPEGWIMVRSVPICVAKDCASIKPLNSVRMFEGWCAAVGEGGLSLAGRIPILQEFYRSVYKSGNGRKAMKHDPTMETGLVMLSKGMGRAYGYIHPRTRFSFWKAFDICPDQQIGIESMYRGQRILYSNKPPSLSPAFQYYNYTG